MPDSNVLIIHPKDNHLKSLINIFKERGDSAVVVHHWDDIKPTDINSASFLVIDVSLGLDYLEKIEGAIPKIILTNSQNTEDYKSIEPDGIEVVEINSPPYNRYQFEKSLVDNYTFSSRKIGEIKKKINKIRMPIRSKITIPFLILAIAIGVFGAYIITRVVFDTVEDRFHNQLLESGKINQEWLVNKESSILETIRVISNMESIDQSIIERDVNTLRDYIYPIIVNEELDSIRILNDHGIQLIRLDHVNGGKVEEYDIRIDPENISAFQVVKNILNNEVDNLGDKYSGLLTTPSDEIFYIGGPIYDSTQSLIGVALVGERINSIIGDMRTSTLTQVTIYDLNGEVKGSSFDLPNKLENDFASTILLDQHEGSYVRSYDIYDITYGEVLSPLIVRGREVIGILGNAIPKSFLLYTSFITQYQIVIFVILAIAMVILVGLIISRLVSKPLMKIIEASKSVESGDYSVKVDALTGDEIEFLASAFNNMVSAVQVSKQEIINAYDKSLDGWSRALELRDKETDFHCQRVADLTLMVAQEIGYPAENWEFLRRGALLHDIGKMGIPDEILLKPGKLNAEEWKIMKKHPVFAMNFLKDISFLESSFEIPYCHHERWDGKGYPNGLKGEDIPLSARIFAIVDVWDAMKSDRPYRKALEEEIIIDYILKEKGHHFDPQVVDPFLRTISKSRLSDNGIE